MKRKIIYLAILTILATSCSKQNEFQSNPTSVAIKKSPTESSSMIWELIIQYKNNAGAYQAGSFCMYEVVSQNLWQCASASVSGQNFTPAMWDTGVSTFQAGIFYYVIPPGNYPKDVLKIKYDYVTCSPSPDSYFVFNKDTKQYSCTSTGCGVTYQIIRFNDTPFGNYD